MNNEKKIKLENKREDHFYEMKDYFSKFNFKKLKDLKDYIKNNELPSNISRNVARFPVRFKKYWVSWEDFLGYEGYFNYEEAKEITYKLRFKTHKEYFEYDGEYRERLPLYPRVQYINKGWISWEDFLGDSYETFNPMSIDYITYDELKTLMIECEIEIKSAKQWREYYKFAELKDHGVPSSPQGFYRGDGWTSWGAFLGHKKIGNKVRKFLTYEEARDIVRKYFFNSSTEYRKFMSETPILKIPKIPDISYKEKGWVSWNDYLGRD